MTSACEGHRGGESGLRAGCDPDESCACMKCFTGYCCFFLCCIFLGIHYQGSQLEDHRKESCIPTAGRKDWYNIWYSVYTAGREEEDEDVMDLEGEHGEQEAETMQTDLLEWYSAIWMRALDYTFLRGVSGALNGEVWSTLTWMFSLYLTAASEHQTSEVQEQVLAYVMHLGGRTGSCKFTLEEGRSVVSWRRLWPPPAVGNGTRGIVVEHVKHV